MKWTNSALSTLQGCGERFRRRYIEEDWRPSGPRAIRGTAVHRVARVGLLRKMTTHTLPSSEEARDLAADAFEMEWSRGVTLTREEIGAGDAVKADSKDFAVDLSAFHIEKVAPAINPVGVERRITVQPQDSDLVIEGTIDLIDRDPRGWETIRDLKTTEKSPPAGTADKSDQLTMYAMIRMAEVGTLPASLILDHLVRTPERHDKKHVIQETERTPFDVAALVERLNTAVEAVSKGVFVPASADAWLCDPRYCEFFHDCPYTQGRARRLLT